MKKSLRNIKKAAAFTLVELIIVIAIITLLAGIVVVTINPASIFANSRNGQRANDISTIQSAITRWLGDSPVSGTARTLDAGIAGYCATYTGSACTGVWSLISNAANGAYNATAIKCDGGAAGTSSALVVANGYEIAANNGTRPGTNRNLDLSVIINAGYLPKTPADPQGTDTTTLGFSGGTPGSNYYMCIDTTIPSGSTNSNPGKLVIYAPKAEAVNGTTTIPYAVI